MTGATHAHIMGNLPGPRHRGPVNGWDAAHDLPGVFSASQEQAGPLSERHVQAGWRPMVLLALRLDGRAIL